MSIKSAVKEHFTQSPISDHWNYFFQDTTQDEEKSLYCVNGLTIYKFTLKDFDECARLYKKVFSAGPWYDEWTLTQTRKYLNELIKNPAFTGFVIRYNYKIVGVCLGHGRSWWMGNEFIVDEFFVEKRMQGNGIGTKLMNVLSGYLSKKGYTRLMLLTNKGIPAENFYLKHGFYNRLERTVMVKEL
ncbi:GNAT family N-acetyltransferase [Methanobacterium alcaliphilum]|uniref:GNAT family N-acetyltransferase n=1 Tax=Methanobacterium alcaliphilum TaxID=392018 RepID=UPI00200B357F|nr:GNAT family N-acetyltransferase [Methanobacterium alcaliphilum]MCK9151386.1 GNAT family N-acetyltransferase [Methanobacterium alcaliphilum]